MTAQPDAPAWAVEAAKEIARERPGQEEKTRYDRDRALRIILRHASPLEERERKLREELLAAALKRAEEAEWQLAEVERHRAQRAKDHARIDFARRDRMRKAEAALDEARDRLASAQHNVANGLALAEERRQQAEAERDHLRAEVARLAREVVRLQGL